MKQTKSHFFIRIKNNDHFQNYIIDHFEESSIRNDEWKTFFGKPFLIKSFYNYRVEHRDKFSTYFSCKKKKIIIK